MGRCDLEKRERKNPQKSKMECIRERKKWGSMRKGYCKSIGRTIMVMRKYSIYTWFDFLHTHTHTYTHRSALIYINQPDNECVT